MGERCSSLGTALFEDGQLTLFLSPPRPVRHCDALSALQTSPHKFECCYTTDHDTRCSGDGERFTRSMSFARERSSRQSWRNSSVVRSLSTCETKTLLTHGNGTARLTIRLSRSHHSCRLFPKLPLWGGVLVTSVDVFLILFVYRPGSGIRAFELLIGTLVSCSPTSTTLLHGADPNTRRPQVIIVLACFIILLVRVDPNWADVFRGYVPSRTLVGSKALYVSVSIL